MKKKLLSIFFVIILTFLILPTNMIGYTVEYIDSSNILEKAITEETLWAEEANRRRERQEKIIEIIRYCTIALGFTLAIYFATKIKKYKKVLKSLTKLEPTNKLEYYKELPDERATLGEVVFLLEKQYEIFSIHFGQIFSSTLLNLSLKNYIELRIDKDKKDKDFIKIVNLNKEITNLKDDEKEILEFVLKAIGKKEEISMKKLEKYISKHSLSVIELIKKTIENVQKSMKENGNLDEQAYKKYESYYVYSILYPIIGICTLTFSLLIKVFSEMSYLLMITLAIIYFTNAIYCKKITKNINLLTQKGIDQKEMWKGLKKYMEDFSLLNEKEVPSLVVWEQYLVYATAFGIADKALKQLKIVYPNIDEMYGINTSAYMYFMYHSNFNSSFSKAIDRLATG